MAEKKSYDNISEYVADYHKFKETVVNDKESLQSLRIGKESLVDIIKQGLEKSVDSISGQYLIEEKQVYWDYMVRIQNLCNDCTFASYIPRDIQGYLGRIFPDKAAQFSAIKRKDFEKALLVVSDDAACRQKIDSYWENPALEVTNEYIRARRRLKQEVQQQLNEEKPKKQPLLSKRLRKGLFLFGFLTIGASTVLSYYQSEQRKVNEELATVKQQVLARNADKDNDGYISQREKFDFYKHFADRNSINFVNGHFKDSNGNDVEPEKLIRLFSNYRQ